MLAPHEEMVRDRHGGCRAVASPVAARAATITVDPQVSPGCMGTTCRSLDAAASMIGDGDTVVVRPGTYLSGPLTLHATT